AVPEFGRLLCYDHMARPIIGTVITLLIGLVLTVGFALDLGGPKPRMAITGVIVGAIFLAVAAFLIIKVAETTTWLYEFGVLHPWGKTVRKLAYKDVAQVGYGVWSPRNQDMRQISITLRPRDGSKDIKFIAFPQTGGQAKPGRMSESQVHEIGGMLTA